MARQPREVKCKSKFESNQHNRSAQCGCKAAAEDEIYNLKGRWSKEVLARVPVRRVTAGNLGGGRHWRGGGILPAAPLLCQHLVINLILHTWLSTKTTGRDLGQFPVRSHLRPPPAALRRSSRFASYPMSASGAPKSLADQQLFEKTGALETGVRSRWLQMWRKNGGKSRAPNAAGAGTAPSGRRLHLAGHP